LCSTYFLDNNVYIGTNQMSLYLRGVSDYRPDFHMGILFPFTEHISAEAALGVDFYTALIIALAVIDEDSSIDYKFATNFYSPYFTFSAGLRFEFDAFALKLITQTQLGGYLQKETSAFQCLVMVGARGSLPLFFLALTFVSDLLRFFWVRSALLRTSRRGYPNAHWRRPCAHRKCVSEPAGTTLTLPSRLT
jgi:hypothetical protein